MTNTTISTMVNGTINAELDVFIVPNKANLVSDWLIESTRNQMIKRSDIVADQNGYEFNPETDKLVQLWFTGMNCDNLTDHVAMVQDENGNKYAFRAENIERLPAKLFDGHKEGDIIDLTFPVTCRRRGEEIQATVNAKVRLNQKDYRYRRFGSFEETLAAVI